MTERRRHCYRCTQVSGADEEDRTGDFVVLVSHSLVTYASQYSVPRYGHGKRKLHARVYEGLSGRVDCFYPKGF